MRELVIDSKNRTISFDGDDVCFRWTSEVDEDIPMHGFNIRTSVIEMVLTEMDDQYKLTKDEKVLIAYELTKALSPCRVATSIH